jgi:hypothetical protein
VNLSTAIDRYRYRALARRGTIIQQPPTAAIAPTAAAIAPTATATATATAAFPSITAAASRPPRRAASAQAPSRQRTPAALSWQAEAWAAYDEVGEERFLASTLSGRLSQARLYVQHKPAAGPHSSLRDDETDVADTAATAVSSLAEAVLAALGASQQDLGQMLQRLATNLFVAGEGWLVGVPAHLVPGIDSSDPTATAPSPDPSLSDLVWRVLAVTEVRTVEPPTQTAAGRVRLALGTDAATPVEVSTDEIYMIRVWRPHPARYWEADSPTRACLPILRELIGLTRHISAQIDSRLAGAGLLVVPSSASAALASDAADAYSSGQPDPFVSALMESMLRPIENRDDASAVVPLVVTVPDEAADKVSHLTFSSALDSGARDLRDEAIRRLALAQDAPPELLLGSGAMNHWGAWLTREDTVTTHIEPVLALICEALTSQYLRPVLLSAGLSEDVVRTLSVGYDVSALVARPNRSEEALNLHKSGAISDEALREASGFDDSDEKPLEERALMNAIALATKQPALLTSPGLGPITEELLKVYRGDYSAPPASLTPAAGAQGGSLPAPGTPSSSGGAPGRPSNDQAPGRLPSDQEPVSSENGAHPESPTTPPTGA